MAQTETIGKVYLIGAGPGDLGLFTLKGKHFLQQAEVVVYDRLVGEDILAMMPANAEKINVGKNSGHHPVPQWQINQILLDKAKEGKMVVRLKGGDGFLFGRGGEELELLLEHNVPFEVIPGIPSPVAGTAYAGIPLTHRDCTDSVHFITGHRKNDGALSLDYEALVRLHGTLVFMMSVATCTEIAQGLIGAGMDPDADAAIIENATRPNQRRFVFPLKDMGKALEEHHIVPPALIVVGKVCGYADTFDWFTKQPLFGQKILVTAPATSSGKLAERLKRLGAAVSVCPCIKTVSLPFAIPDMTRYSAAVFTSAFGVHTFFAALHKAGYDARYFAHTKLAVIGTGTAAALNQYGLKADLIPATYDAESLANSMLAQGMVSEQDNVILLRARQANPILQETLTGAGVAVENVSIYDTLPLPYSGEAPDRFAYVTFTSASGVASFVESCKAGGYHTFESIRALCIGKQTAAAAEKAGMRVCIAKRATLDSMVDYLQEVCKS